MEKKLSKGIEIIRKEEILQAKLKQAKKAEKDTIT